MNLLSVPFLSASTTVLLAIGTYVYHRRKFAGSVTRALGLEKFPTYVIRGVGYKLAGYLRPRVAARLSLRNFAINRLAASSAKVMVPAAIPVELNLDHMFVPLTAVSSEHARVSAGQVAHSGDYRRVLLVGDPGSGKSTLVKRVYRDICRNAISAKQNGRIPVLVELKNLDGLLAAERDPKRRNLFEVVKSNVTSVQTYSGEDLFESFLNDGRVTVMLDGLDEVKTSDFDRVSAEILKFCTQLANRNPGNRIIVTTRRQLYVNLAEDFAAAFDSHLTLEPFTPDDMYEFLGKWPYKANSQREFARIFANLSAQPNIRSMCQTPLILAMYVATDQITGGEGLPETRPDFYRAVTDELLVRRRGRQHGLTTGLNVLRRNRQQILGRLALEHLLDGKQSRNTLQFESAIRIVRENSGGEMSDVEAGRLLRELSRDTGLFTEEKREESLRFIHLTFCEFLAGQYIAQGAVDSWRTISDAVEGRGAEMNSSRAAERFSEVVVFATALESNEHLRKERIRWVLEHGGSDLALRVMLDAQPYDDQHAVCRLMEIADEVACVESSGRDEAWFHLLRQVAVVLRDRELVEGAMRGGAPSQFLARFFMKTANESSAELKNLLLPYLRLDPAGALQLIYSMGEGAVSEYSSLLVKALDEPAVLAHALAKFTSNTEGMRTWGSILALGSVYHRSVSQRLRLMKANEILEKQTASAGGRRRGWHRCWLTRGTVLGEVLEAGIRWPGKSVFLEFMATVTPRSNRATDLLASISIGAALGSVAVSVALTAFLVLLLGFPFWFACWQAVPILLTFVSLFAFRRNRWNGTRSFLREYESPYVRGARISDYPLPFAVLEALRSSSRSTFRILRLVRRETGPRYLLISMDLCGNSRLMLLGNFIPFLVVTDLSEDEATTELLR